MATVDSLDIAIQASTENANKSLDSLIQKIGLIAEGINAIGKNSGLQEFSKKIQESTKNFANIQSTAKGLSSGITSEMQKASKSFDEIAAKYKDLGKGFKFVGSTSTIQKQIDGYTNALEKAKLKKDELETRGKISGQGYEDAIKDIQKYENIIASLKNQLAEIQNTRPKLDINISGIEEARQKVSDITDKITQNTAALMGRRFNPDAMAAVFGESAREIEDWGQVIERVGNNAVIKLHELEKPFDINISGIEEAGQQLDALSGQWQNMTNLFSQTFSDLKSGALWEYLSNGVKDYVKNAQVAAGLKIYTDDYRNVLSDIERTEGALEKLEQKQRDMQAAGTSEESKEWQKVAYEITAAESRLDSYINRRNEMESSGADVKFSGGLANESILKSMGAVAGEAMSSLRQRIGEIGGAVSQAVGNIPIIGRIAKESAFLGQTAFNGLKFAVSGIASVAQKAVSGLSRIASAISKLVSGIKGAISKFSSLAKSMIGIKGASKGVNASFSGGLKTLLKYGLGIRSLYVLFNRLRNAAKEAFKNLAQYSPETNAAISSLTSSLGALKNSIATAFAPVLNVVAPILSTFIDLLTRAFNAVGRFFAALTGKSFAVQSVKNFSDYAAGISKTGGAAKKAAKDIKTYTLGIDELNIITEDTSEESGAGGGAEILPEDMFETVEVEDKFKNWADWLKDMWANADFYELGKLLGEKLKNALDNIEWEPIKETAAKIGESIGTLINGFVEVEGLADSIGRTIGEAINTRTTGINAFLDNTHWDSVGKFIGEGLNGIVNTVNWEGLGHLFAAKWNAIFETIGEAARTFDWANFGLQLATSINTFIKDFKWAENGAHFGELIKGLLDTLIALLEETDWQLLGNGVADFITSIDWTGIFERLAEGIGAALGGLAAFLWGLIEDAWNNVVAWWNEVAFEDGQFTMKGLLNGISDVISNIGQWIVEHIFNPFVDGFKKAFGIHSPADSMIPIGENILLGVIDGFKSKFDSFTSAIQEFFDNYISPWFTAEKWSELWAGVQEGIMLKWNEIVAWWQESAIYTWWEEHVAPWFTAEKWQTLLDNVKNAFQTKWSEISGKWQTNIKTWWDNNVTPWFTLKKWSDAMVGIVDGFKQTFKNAANSAISIFNNLIDWINDKMHFSWDAITIAGKTIVPSGSVQLFTIPHIPQFELGGFPEDGLFFANRTELVGEFSNGKTAVANNAQIVEGISIGVESAVRSAVADILAPYLADIAQNTRETAEKDMSVVIGDTDIAEANRRGETRLGFNFSQSYA